MQRKPRLFHILKKRVSHVSVLLRNVKKTKREWWKRRGRPFYCCCCEWIFWLNENFIKRERRAGGASVKLHRARQTHARAGSKTFFYFPVRIRRRLIAGAPFPAVFQLSGNVSGEKRERNDRWLAWQVPKGSLGRRIAPAAGGVMQKAAHRCNAACIKQLLCGFCSRSTQH